MSANDPDFQKQIVEVFKGEAEEHIQILTNELVELEKNFAEKATDDTLQRIYREAHSLKGAARAVGFETIQNICQVFENILALIRDKKFTPEQSYYQTAFEVLDYVKELVQKPEEKLENPEKYNELVRRLNAFEHNDSPQIAESPEPTEEAAPPKEESAQPPSEAQNQEASAPQAPDTPQSETPPQQAPHEQTPAQEAPPQQATPATETKEEPSKNQDRSVKVSTAKLDQIITQIEELLPLRVRYTHLAKRLHSLMEMLEESGRYDTHVQELRMLLQTRIPNTDPLYHDFSKAMEAVFSDTDERSQLCKNEVKGIEKDVVNDVHLIDSALTSLVEGSRELLMQPFELLFVVFPRMVRDIAAQLKKEVDFSVEGGNVEIDRRILDDLKDPLMHLVRNSIDHGIELPEEREKNGKARQGKITLAVNEVGDSHVDITISDDGRGFNLDKLKAKAMDKGVLPQDKASTISKEELIGLTLQSGISSADIITEISGRGLGLGILAEKVEQNGGTYTVDTEEGKGTSIRISVPLTIATFRGVHVQSGEQTYIIPSKNIQRVVRKCELEESTVLNQDVVFLDQKNYSFRHLNTLLGVSSEKQTGDVVMLISSGPSSLAIGVDSIIREEEIYVKSLGTQLQSVPGISAATIMGGNKVVPIINVRDLLTAMQQKTSSPAPVSAQQGDSSNQGGEKKTVLLVEDTMTTRLLLKNIFEGAGYHAITAADGAEAYDLILKNSIDLLVTDIEMPRVSGFELIEKIKGNEKTKTLPVIIISARESDEDKRRGVELGVEAYIEKSKFIQKELISITKKVI